MVYRVLITPAAHQDLDDYAAWIAADSPSQARRWLMGAWEKIFSLAEMPHRYAVIDEADELGVKLRDLNHFSHRIVYLVRDDEQIVEIIRVWHSARLPLESGDIES